MSPCGGECRVGRTLLRGGPSSPAHAGAGADPRRRQHRPIATNKRSTSAAARRPPRPLPHRAPHRRLAQFAHPAGRSRMPIALHGLALGKASDAISPLNAVVEPGAASAAAATASFVRRDRPSSIVRPQPDSAKTESAKTKLRRRPAAAAPPRRLEQVEQHRGSLRSRVALLTDVAHECGQRGVGRRGRTPKTASRARARGFGASVGNGGR
jgi:hypothetical protein